MLWPVAGPKLNYREDRSRLETGLLAFWNLDKSEERLGYVRESANNRILPENVSVIQVILIQEEIIKSQLDFVLKRFSSLICNSGPSPFKLYVSNAFIGR